MTAVPLPETIGVFGGGRMGAGIAHSFLLAGCNVVLIEVDKQAAARAELTVRGNVQRSADRGKLSEPRDGIDPVTSVMARFSAGSDDGALRGAGLIVEAVPEDVQLKLSVLGRAAAVVDDSAMLASNTSSISIDELGAAVPSPGRFLGLHFFNPVPASSLIEIIIGSQTTGEVTTTAQGWVRALGKTPVTVRNVPGFASSRLGVALGLEAIRMLEEGVATAEDIDAAMALGYKHPVGPLRLTDIVGLDVRLAIAEYLQGELGDRFAPPQLLRDTVAAGHLGQKSGQGFYSWPQD
ncbi:3-hydroxyacyl-CoA dehydrogenase family protein [Saxibacter everestensis]|uniref:3-hydroxyacyl-CoA dehydrogenase family protein n=1 Tax=Saxibacter everestensis TaxID=2909229 RepID=A0ABY8QQA0_9MICO|nr:3-hydroxyacyl-CoA dehydrogenase family protein [Brevibacteriaceae bacterium ZFBP1038]